MGKSRKCAGPAWPTAWVARVVALASTTIVALTFDPGNSQAQAGPTELDTVDVIDTAPLPGTVTPRDAVPTHIQTGTARQIADERAATIGEFINNRFGGVYINEAQSNRYQPDVLYRGFVASPLLGNPIGLSVFIDGVRVNESFGDAVLWDLIPQAAIESVNLIPGSNPVYGLNTLGGALTLRTKSGRTSPGVTATAGFGSFGRRDLEASYGHVDGAFDAFLSVERQKDDGWRDHSPSDVRRVFGKLGWSSGRTDLSLSLTHADNELTGNGLVPESLYRQRREAIYTYPDLTEPRLSFIKLAGSHQLDAGWTLSSNVYYRRLKIRTANGDAEFDDEGTLDLADDSYSAEFRGTQSTQTTTGVGVQLSRDGMWAGRRNRFAVGLGIDHGKTRFQQSEQEGVFTSDRGVEPAGDPELETDVIGRNRYQSLYLTDVVSATDRLDVTISARYMIARVSIDDQTGAEEELNGSHRFQRLAPALGATYRLRPRLTIYGGYNEGFRVPTAVELTCADPTAPCSLPVAFVADPPLKAVVVRTFEAGARGRAFDLVRWNAGLFRSNLRDDILFTSTGAGQGFFSNVPRTRREGIELGVASDRRGRFDWFANYSYTRATYRTEVELFNGVATPSDPSTPATTTARSGNRLPGIPSHLMKAGGRWNIDDRFSVGSTVNVVGDQVFRGDESNSQPRLGGYTVFNLQADYRFLPSWRLFGRVNNVFDKRYASLGAYNRVAFNADSEPLEGVGPGPVSRFVSPGMPRSFWLGIEYRPGGRD